VNKQAEDISYKSSGAVIPFLKRMFRYVLKDKRIFYGFLVGIIVVGLTDALWPLLWMHLLDEIIVPAVNSQEKSGVAINGLWFYAGIFMLNGVIQVLAVYFFVKMAGAMQENILYDLRKEMFNKLQRLSHSYYDKSALGWLISRITSDSDRVSELISWGLVDAIWGITMIIFSLSAMFFYNWKLALIVLVSMPILMLISVKLRMLILKYSRASRKINSEMTASFTEHIQGVEVNKMTGQETRISNEFGDLSMRMRRATYKSVFYTAMYLPIVIFIGAFTASIIILVGGRMAMNVPAGITVGIMAAFFAYATRIFEPIMDITRFYAMAQNSLSAGERIFGLIDEEVLIKDEGQMEAFSRIKGEIDFQDVGFYYNPDKLILNNFNLKIKAGQSVALVGATGEGKTTITNLIGRFYEPTSGSIIIDGVNYKERKLHSLRTQLGMVLQSPHLFLGTIRENICYKNQSASDDDILKVLKDVGAEYFIDRLGEDVGEGGEKLSMGERQLISFIRTIIADPAIFIMDEATSSVDVNTERMIQSALDKLIKNRTSVIVAHRLSTIKNCDRIIVISKGKIIEDGNHSELMKAKAHYYNLYKRQIRKSISPEALAALS